MSLDTTEVGMPVRAAADAQALKLQRRHARRLRVFEPELVRMATQRSFLMLDPRVMARNPVMFLVEVGTVLSALVTAQSIMGGAATGLIVYQVALTALLLLTVLFANFAEALAEARGKAQADSLRATRQDTQAFRLDSRESQTGRVVSSTELRAGDYVVVLAGQVIPSDGEVIEGVASVDESAITGESAPVIREAGGDRSGVTGGTRVLSDRIIVQITAGIGESFLDRMIALVEGAIRQKTPNEIALTIVLAAFSIIFMIVTTTLYPMARYFDLTLDIPTLVALLVCLIPTTIGALWRRSASQGWIGRSWRTSSRRAARRSNWLATSTRCSWTRPVRSRWATGGRPKSSRSVVRRSNTLRSRPHWRRWPTRRPKARAFSSWPARRPHLIARRRRARSSSSSPHRHG